MAYHPERNSAYNGVKSTVKSGGRQRRRPQGAEDKEVMSLRLGRYPFAAMVEIFKERRVGLVAESTLAEDHRKLKHIGRIFEDLKAQGLIETTDPRHFEREHIQQLLRHMRAKGLDPASQAKILQELKNLLKFCKNHVMDEMKADGVKFPKPTKKPIRVIADEDLTRIFSAVDRIEGWRGSMAQGMTALYFATGVRPKELRLAHLEDLDVGKMTLFVRHPKGEASWASREEVSIIRRDMIPLIQAYLGERSRAIAACGMEGVVPLFPNLKGGSGTFYTAQGFNAIKRMVEDASGVKFRLKDFRSTLATITINNDMSRLPAMSQQLRHSKVETTQKFYARIDPAAASKQLQKAYLERPVLLGGAGAPVLSAQTGPNAMMHKTPLIGKNFEPTGYA